MAKIVNFMHLYIFTTIKSAVLGRKKRHQAMKQTKQCLLAHGIEVQAYIGLPLGAQSMSFTAKYLHLLNKHLLNFLFDHLLVLRVPPWIRLCSWPQEDSRPVGTIIRESLPESKTHMDGNSAEKWRRELLALMKHLHQATPETYILLNFSIPWTNNFLWFLCLLFADLFKLLQLKYPFFRETDSYYPKGKVFLKPTHIPPCFSFTALITTAINYEIKFF